ncbi:hypothetical protein D3C83_98740 [compost metagenome]
MTVSATPPTDNCELTVAVKSEVNSMASRLTVVKPVSENVTVYVPGRRLTIE